MNLSKLLIGAFVFIGGVMPVAAHQAKYTAPLLGSNEVPIAATPATGTVLVTIDFDLVTMRVEASFSDLLGNVTAAHIHCCTATPEAGTAGVATQVPNFVGFPLGVTAGAYDFTFDLSSATSWNLAFITANGGSTCKIIRKLLFLLVICLLTARRCRGE